MLLVSLKMIGGLRVGIYISIVGRAAFHQILVLTFHLAESVEYNSAGRGEAFIYEDFGVPALSTNQDCLTFRIPTTKFNYYAPIVRNVFAFTTKMVSGADIRF